MKSSWMRGVVTGVREGNMRLFRHGSALLPALMCLASCESANVQEPEPQPPEIAVAVAPDSLLLALGEQVALRLDVTVDGVAHVPPADSVEWLTRDPGVAGVAAGVATGAGHGTTFVVARYGEARDSVRVAVLAGVAILPTELAFTRTEADLGDEIYRMERDGSVQPLTGSPGSNASPAWSPDGERIAFVSTRDGNEEIYVMRSDGADETNVSGHPGGDGDPVWSPDGERIAFVSFRDGNTEIYVMNSDGSGQVNLTQHPGADRRPSWSPDGARIAFERFTGTKTFAYVMNADGSDAHRLTTDTLAESTPRWSPDGQLIAFLRDVTRGAVPRTEADLWVSAPDGSGLRPLTAERFSEWGHRWSPDGSSIVYTRDFDDPEILVVRVEDGDTTQLTTLAEASEAPVWSPDGSLLAFESSRDALPQGGANEEIYVMTPTGDEQTNMTGYAGADREPAWRPRP